MGFDLRRKNGDDFSISLFTWIRVCALAIEGGWEPQGTLPPAHWSAENGPWAGTYDSNDEQQVTEEDARAMAVALEMMLPALKTEKGFDRESDDPTLLWGTRVDPVSYFSDPGKRKILELMIGFLKRGAFEIH